MSLRDVTQDDLPFLFEHQQDPLANQMAAFPAREWDPFIAHWTTKILANENVVKKTIVLDGVVIGYILAFEQGGKRLVGYWIGRSHWGKGAATDALSTFLRHVEERPLYACVAAHNIASLRVLEKCGFSICGETVSGGGEVEGHLVQLSASVDGVNAAFEAGS